MLYPLSYRRLKPNQIKLQKNGSFVKRESGFFSMI